MTREKSEGAPSLWVWVPPTMATKCLLATARRACYPLSDRVAASSGASLELVGLALAAMQAAYTGAAIALFPRLARAGRGPRALRPVADTPLSLPTLGIPGRSRGWPEH